VGKSRQTDKSQKGDEMSSNAFDELERQYSQDLDRWETAREQRQKRQIVIAACPFCGNEDVLVDEVKPNVIAICCEECQMIGPHHDTDQPLEVAIKRWNERK
jgi:Lar family restriction alleviation protein